MRKRLPGTTPSRAGAGFSVGDTTGDADGDVGRRKRADPNHYCIPTTTASDLVGHHCPFREGFQKLADSISHVLPGGVQPLGASYVAIMGNSGLHQGGIPPAAAGFCGARGRRSADCDESTTLLQYVYSNAYIIRV